MEAPHHRISNLTTHQLYWFITPITDTLSIDIFHDIPTQNIPMPLDVIGVATSLSKKGTSCVKTLWSPRDRGFDPGLYIFEINATNPPMFAVRRGGPETHEGPCLYGLGDSLEPESTQMTSLHWFVLFRSQFLVISSSCWMDHTDGLGHDEHLVGCSTSKWGFLTKRNPQSSPWVNHGEPVQEGSNDLNDLGKPHVREPPNDEMILWQTWQWNMAHS